MSDVIDAAVKALGKKMADGFEGTAKFIIKDEGGIIIDGAGVRASDDDADVTLTANAETFQSIMSGDLNATSAFMTGKLTVDGDMGLAMTLAGYLT